MGRTPQAEGTPCRRQSHAGHRNASATLLQDGPACEEGGAGSMDRDGATGARATAKSAVRPHPLPSSLLVRPPAGSGESWPGYLLRLCEANEIEGAIPKIASLLGMSLPKLIAHDPREVLAALGVPVPHDLTEHQPNQREASQPTRLVHASRTQNSRVCPACIREDPEPYVRATWESPVALRCERHDTLLIDCCGACGRRVDMRRQRVAFCPCGADFRLHACLPVPDEVRRLEELFTEGFHPRPATTFQLPSPAARKAARVIQWLSELQAESRKIHNKKFRIQAPVVTARTATSLAPILEDWNTQVVQLVSRHFDLSRSRAVHALHYRLGADTFDHCKAVVENIRSRFISTARKQIPWTSCTLAKERETWGIEKLTKITGLGYESIVRCIDQGNLPGATYSIDKKTGRNVFRIPASLLRSIQEAYYGTDRVKTAAQAAGCSMAAMMGLVRSGCIRTVNMAGARHYAGAKRVESAEVARMARKLFDLASSDHEGKVVDPVRFSDWVSGPSSPANAPAWRRVLEALRHGQLKLYKQRSSPGALDELFVSQAELQDVLR